MSLKKALLLTPSVDEYYKSMICVSTYHGFVDFKEKKKKKALMGGEIHLLVSQVANKTSLVGVSERNKTRCVSFCRSNLQKLQG